MSAALAGKLAALRRWALASRILLIGYMLTCFAGLVGGGAQLASSDRYELPDYLQAAAGLALAIGQLFLILSIFTILAWLYRAHANLRTIGLHGLNYSPGWAVGSFFVPIVNLIVPFRATRELYNRSMGEEAYFASGSVGDVSSWWTCYIVGNLIQVFLIGMILIDRLTSIYFTTPVIANGLLAWFAILLLAGSAFFLFRIIGAVTKAQQLVTGIGDTFA